MVFLLLLPKAIIDDLQRRTRDRRGEQVGAQLSVFDDFNGLPDPGARRWEGPAR